MVHTTLKITQSNPNNIKLRCRNVWMTVEGHTVAKGEKRTHMRKFASTQYTVLSTLSMSVPQGISGYCEFLAALLRCPQSVI
jgi:hypothetical protein